MPLVEFNHSYNWGRDLFNLLSNVMHQTIFFTHGVYGDNCWLIEFFIVVTSVECTFYIAYYTTEDRRRNPVWKLKEQTRDVEILAVTICHPV